MGAISAPEEQQYQEPDSSFFKAVLSRIHFRNGSFRCMKLIYVTSVVFHDAQPIKALQKTGKIDG